MNISRYIFSFKLVIVFALVTFLGAVPKPADAGHRVKCPCSFTKVYAASVAQARALGVSNKAETCQEGEAVKQLMGESSPGCVTVMVTVLDSPEGGCAYSFGCEIVEVGFYLYNSQFVELTQKEVTACRSELNFIAWLSGVRCMPPG